MSIRDLSTELLSEQDARIKQADYWQTAVRMPEYLFTRLDAIASRCGLSRNRLIVKLLDESTFELACELSRDEQEGPIQWDVVQEMIEDIPASVYGK